MGFSSPAGIFSAELGPGNVVGELAALSPKPRSATVTAIENCSLLRLDQRDLNELLDSNAAVARCVIEALANYLHERGVTMAKLKKQSDY